MLRQCHSLNRLLQEWGCSCHDRSQPGPSRHLLSTATWTLQSRLDMHSFSCVTIRAREGALLFRIGEIFHCHSGGCSQSLVRDTVKIPVPMPHGEVCWTTPTRRSNPSRTCSEHPSFARCAFTIGL